MAHQDLATAAVLGFALLLSLVLTRGMINLANRKKWLVPPKADRWHQKPTALYGGIAIVATYTIGCLALLVRPEFRNRYDLIGLFSGGMVLFIVGLCDDAYALNPLVKLLGQVMSVTPFLVGAGLAFTSAIFVVSIPLVLFWMVALSNAFNLLDNMDGLSAGTAVVVGLVLSAYCFLRPTVGFHATGALCALTAASSLGFLYFNFRRKGSARIFMGDCGSMFLGYMLSGLAVIAFCPTAPSSIVNGASQCALALLVMALPILDTTLVIIIRKREGRAISQGGKDHTSHRLVYSGFSEKQAVLILFGVSLLGGLAALVVARQHQPARIFLVLAGCTVLLVRFGAYLSRFSGVRPLQGADNVASPQREPVHRN